MAPGSTALASFRKLAKRLFRRQEDALHREIADFLSQVPLFSPLSRSMLIDLAEFMHERSYPRDEYLYYQDDPGIGLYVIRRGGVRLQIATPDEAIHELRVAGERELLGELCLIGGGVLRRTESAQAASDTVVLGLFSPEFRTLQRRHPKTGAAVATLMARQFALGLRAVRDVMTERDNPTAAAEMMADANARAIKRMNEMPAW